MIFKILGAMRARAPFRDWLYRWLVVAATAVVAGIGLFVTRLSLDNRFLLQASILLLLPLAIGSVFSVLAWRIRSLTFLLSACAHFFFSVGQLLAFSAFGIVLTYVAASASLPLMDEVFARLDADMGFRWNDANVWFHEHSALLTILWIAYLSTGAQLITLFFIHSTREPREGSGELIWTYMVSLLIVILISVFLPAAAKSGMIGQHHIDVFLAARSHSVTVLNEATLAGIIAFPSFHAVIAAILTYSARTMKWLLAIFAPLNVLLIVATLPCGGHYLVDTIAGLAVAAVSILVVRKVRRSIAGQQLTNTVARRADGWGQA
jgi:membrane-associated phospholipid phosphatase